MNKEASIRETKRFFDEINDPEAANREKKKKELEALKQERISDAGI